MKDQTLILKEVFSQPTAPYKEGWVLQKIRFILTKNKIPFFSDKFGNLIAGVRNIREMRQKSQWALVAHTDHPGFHILEHKSGNVYKAKWFGGVPPRSSGACLRIHHPLHPGKSCIGRVLSKTIDRKKGGLFELRASKGPFEIDSTCFGAFDYPGFQKRGTRIYTRAADDLAGVAIILSTLVKTKNVIGVFSRAEEVGFQGTLGMIYENIFPKNMKFISLEASKRGVGARTGKGVVVRLGDRSSLFDTDITRGLERAALMATTKNPKFCFQKKVMEGGTCEATAFNFSGYASGGMSLPLGNYHNETSSGKPGPEMIDLRDYHSAVELLRVHFENLKKVSGYRRDYVKSMKKSFGKQKQLLLKPLHFRD